MYSFQILFFAAAFAGPSLSQKSDAEFCASKMSSFFSWVRAEGPTTPAAVLSFLATQTDGSPPLTHFGPSLHGDEICSIYKALPASLRPEFQTYITSELVFGKANSDVLIGVATDCVPQQDVASVTDYIHNMLTATGNSCQPTPAPGSAANGSYPTSPAPTATPTPTGTGSYYVPPSNSSYVTSVVTAAAARATGALLGAAALGGVLGAAVML
ncbi:hypothetical protein F5Y14DRAFT_433224 [Nemania sp. NC0429]|nr:hypothetical protein F5Y14DRAFT_433224 [Nemania sp. NC0429]